MSVRPRFERAITCAATAAMLLATACSVNVSKAEPTVVPPSVDTYQIQEATHVNTPVQYPQDPPVGGRHNPQWLNCGFYDQPVPNELAVHSLEHGAVWITFRPDLPSGQQDTLRALAHDSISKGYVLVSPYANLASDTPVVASAWGKQMRLKSFDLAALRNFIRTFASGPQTPEPGAPCSGGSGQPK